MINDILDMMIRRSRRSAGGGESGGGSGESSGNATITVTGFGEAVWQKFNTTYELNASDGTWDGDGVLIRYDVRNGSNCWIFLADGETDLTFAPYILSNDSDPMSIIGTQRSDNIYETYNTLTITLVEGGSGESGDSDKTYVYTVSGAGTTEANGDYWDSGETYDSSVIYTNGTCRMYQHYNAKVIFNSSGTALYYNTSGFTASGWSVELGTAPAPTVTEYVASGDSGSGMATIVVTGCATDAFNQSYELTSGDVDNPLPCVFTGTTDSSYSVFVLTDGEDYGEVDLRNGEVTIYTKVAVSGSTVQQIVNESSNYNWLAMADGAVQNTLQVVYNPASGDGGSGGEQHEYVYTVSGFVTHNTEANGNYWATGETNNGYPVYTNGTTVMFVNGIYWNGYTIDDEINDGGAMAYTSSKDPVTGAWTDGAGSDTITVTAL